MTGAAILVGDDPADLGTALDGEGFAVTRVAVGNRPNLEEAGVHDATVYVLTDLDQATSITVAADCNPDLRIVVYASGSLPAFATRQTDLLVDPDLLSPTAVAEELAGTAE